MASELSPAYLLAGTDASKIDAALGRLRARAEAEGGPGALEVFAAEGTAAPDADALVASIPALSLTAARRYLVADGVERWTPKQAKPVIEALADLPGDLTVVLVARESPPKVRAPKGVADAVKAAGGEVLRYDAPKLRELPAWVAAEARRRGFEIEPDATRVLVDRMGESTIRLSTELDRLAVWAEPGQTVMRGDLDEMVADTSEEASWTLADALIERDTAGALEASERLAGQGEATTPLIWAAAKRLREAHRAVSALERGRPPKEVEASLSMHPYAAKMLVRRVRGASPQDMRAALCALADLEWWTRGGSDYPTDVAVTLALRRATGV